MFDFGNAPAQSAPSEPAAAGGFSFDFGTKPNTTSNEV
jgi:hypothetical protein